jgi:hypothetical protein
MVKIRPMEQNVRRYVRGSLEVFLRGEKNLNWVKGVIRKSGILQYKGMLQEIFDNLQGYEKLSRYQEILKECQGQNWL